MPRYVDGYVIPIRKSKLAAYRRMARQAGKLWKDHGALEFMECAGDDLQTGFAQTFLKLAKAKPGETVLFSFIVHRSRKDRDRTNKKVENDPRLAAIVGANAMPFDMKRITFGGFKAMVDL